MKDYTLFDKLLKMPHNFPVTVTKNSVNHIGAIFNRHWHSQLEILYFTGGKGLVECGSEQIEVSCGSIIVVNSGQLHTASCNVSPFEYYYIIIDINLLKSASPGDCELKYISPIFDNLIVFKNSIYDEEFNNSVRIIIEEYEKKELGYELVIKAQTYYMVALLLRKGIQRVLSDNERNVLNHQTKVITDVLDYIDRNCADKISLDQLAKVSNLSKSRLCHVFKELIGSGVNEYIVRIRLEKSRLMLRETELSIIDIALECGFNDANYFSRIFKKNYGLIPSQYRKN